MADNQKGEPMDPADVLQKENNCGQEARIEESGDPGPCAA
jgi:hypothetical protein